MELDGRKALVTGGSRGIGRAICVALAAAGVSVTFTYRDAAAAEETRAAIESAGGKCLPVEAEMRDRNRTPDVVKAASGDDGRLDILVLNAGTTGPGTHRDISLDEWDRVIDVNLGAAFRYAQAGLERMADGGSILFVGTTAALQGVGPAHYVTAKAALLGLSRALAREVAARKITVNILTPGFVDTAFHGPSPFRDIVRHEVSLRVPLGRMATPGEVAEAALALIRNPYITGSSLAVAGGAVMT
jgi:3-oxoacyl-[acyl-carrier protein] reductase